MMIEDETWPAYERTLRVAKRSPRTIQSYRETLALLEGFLGEEDVVEADERNIQDFLLDQLDRHATSTAALRFRNLRRFYNWAIDEGMITKSPMARLKEPKATDKPPAVVADNDLRTLLSECSGASYEDRRDLAIIRLWCEPGSARVSEMANVDLADLNLKVGTLRLHGKGNKVRVIPFGDKTGLALHRFLRERRKHPLAEKTMRLWLGARGKPLTPSGLYQMLDRRSRAAAIGHVHPHQLRHSAAHQWKVDGGADDEAMALFGWESAAMPLVYGRSARVERAHKTSRRLSQADRL